VVFEYGGTLPPCVNKALHLLALDEQRLAFRPTLMNQDGRVEEVWLAGAHADIGGGYRYDGLADISLKTLMNWLNITLSRPVYDNAAKKQLPFKAEVLRLHPNPEGFLHYQQRCPLWRGLTIAPRHCHVLKQGIPCPDTPPLWHPTVPQRMAIHRDYQPSAKCEIPAKIWGQHLSPVVA
jgi:hypothetical protein